MRCISKSSAYSGYSNLGRPAKLQLPAGVWIDSSDRVYLVDSYHQRVQDFRFVSAKRAAGEHGRCGLGGTGEGTTAIMALILIPLTGAAQHASVQGSPHDLSVNGPGPVKATSETQVCLFCHAVHILDSKSPQPLWNQQLSTTTTYTPYTSSTFKQTTNQPSTRSKLCLSCHDGTVAIGQTYAVTSGKIDMQGSLHGR